MNLELNSCIENTRNTMSKSISHFESELLKIRAGRANPGMLSSISIDYYGTNTPISQIANVTTPDSRTISIQPWEKSILSQISSAIVNSNLGFNPIDNGDILIINVPTLTEERRIELVKKSKFEAENCKISIRSVRKDSNDQLKKLKKEGLPDDIFNDSQNEIQKITDSFIKKVEEILHLKEDEIMTI